MAKKKKAGKPAKGRGKEKPAKGETRRALGPRDKKGPRSQVLPGFKRERNERLDNICEGIAEERERMNAARQEEQGLIQAAMQLMTKKGLPLYKYAHVELTRVPGAEKLRVRIVKDDGAADESDLAPSDADAGDDEDESPDDGADEGEPAGDLG